jgi:integrase
MSARVAATPTDPVGMSGPRIRSRFTGSAPDLSVIEYLAHYANVTRSVSGRYAGAYHRRGLLRRAEMAIGKELLTCTTDDMRDWFAKLQDTNGAASQRASLAGIRAYFSWCIDQGLLDADPTRHLRAPRMPRRRPHPISEPDLARAIAAAEPERLRPILALAAFAGLRAHEIAALHRRDFNTSTVTVIGKGDRERAVDLHPFVLSTVEAIPSSTWLFPRRDGKPGPIDSHRVSAIASEHLHGLGIPFTLHSLRHRFATQLYLATRDLLLVQNLLGHASPTTTQVYTDFDRGSSNVAVSHLPMPQLAPV